MLEKKGKFLEPWSRELQGGFTMLEVLIALGLLGIASLGFMAVMSHLTSTTRRAEALVSKTQFVTALNQYLNSEVGCNELRYYDPAIPGLNFYDATTFDETVPMSAIPWAPLELKRWKIEGVDVIKSGARFPKFDLKSLDASADLSTYLPKVTMPKLPPGEYIENEILTRTMLKVKVVVTIPTPRDYEHTFNVPVFVNAQGVVKYCGNAMNENCHAMGGMMDTFTGLCKFERTCMMMGGFTTSTDPARSIRNDMTNDFTCPEGSTSILMGVDTVGFSIQSCKKCAAMGGSAAGSTRMYSCLKCPPP